MSSFDYDPIDKARSEIRVLSLARPLGPGKAESATQPTINLNLRRVSLLDRPAYCTLSYVWGSPEGKLQILVNGQAFLVTQNLYSALLRIAGSLTRENFWVDAICINQEDNVEKAWQVSQMYHVYSRASRSIVWLGPSLDDSDLALDALDKLGRMSLGVDIHAVHDDIRPLHRDFMQSTGYIEDLELPESFRQFGDLFQRFRRMDETKRADLIPTAPIARILQRPLWERIWIVQEMVSAPNAMICCGDRQVPTATFAAGLELLHLLKEEVEFARFTRTERGTRHLSELDPFVSTLRIWRQYFNLDKPRPMTCVSDLIVILSRGLYRATDPRDLLYALYSFSNASDEPSGNAQFCCQLPEPNYSESTETFFTRFAEACVPYHTHSILGACRFPKNLQNLPSWVPDWTALRTSTATGTSNKRHVWAFQSAGIYDACGSRSGKSCGLPISEVKEACFAFEGYTFDTVEWVAGASLAPGVDYEKPQKDVDGTIGSSTSPFVLSFQLSQFLKGFSNIQNYIFRWLVEHTEAKASASTTKGCRKDSAIYKQQIMLWRTLMTDRRVMCSCTSRDASDEQFHTCEHCLKKDSDTFMLDLWHLFKWFEVECEPETAGPLLPDSKQIWESHSHDSCLCFQILRGLPKALQFVALTSDDPSVWAMVQWYVEFYCTSGHNDYCRGLPVRSSGLLDQILAFNADRRVFRTKRHGTLGLGPEVMRSGDVIVVAEGATVPYVLRAASSYREQECDCYNGYLDHLAHSGLLYEFVGEAYVDGIMYGEYMDQKPRRECFCFERPMDLGAEASLGNT